MGRFLFEYKPTLLIKLTQFNVNLYLTIVQHTFNINWPLVKLRSDTAQLTPTTTCMLQTIDFSHSSSTQTWLKLNPSNHVITDQSLITTFTWRLDTANKITATCSIIFRYHHNNWLPMFHLTKTTSTQVFKASVIEQVTEWYHFFFVVFNWTVVPLETSEWDSHFLNLNPPLTHPPSTLQPCRVSL